MFKAVFLDFYGTLVHEDDVWIDEICGKIAVSSTVQATKGEIGRYWWDSFSSRLLPSYGDAFITQRDIELMALEETIAYFGSTCHSEELCQILFKHWQTLAPMFEDTLAFLRAVDIPRIIVSNIDRDDIEAAIHHNGLTFDHIITSEDARSYKPRSEMFQQALHISNLKPEDVLHIGDSLTNDIVGAHYAGIRAAWINRRNKPLPQHCTPDYTVHSLIELIPLLT